MVHAQVEGEPCFTIAKKLTHKATKTVFLLRFFDDSERGKPAEDFTELLEKELAKNESGLKFRQWLQGYLADLANQGGVAIDTLCGYPTSASD